MTTGRLFTISFLLTTAVLSVMNFLDHRRSAATRSNLVPITEDVFITSQLHPNAMRFLMRDRIRTIVDIRPDGEEPGQPASSEIERVAKAMDMSFYYIPVPHETIPETAVDALKNAFSESQQPTVLYCRTGRRAVRLFALAEASRPNGPDAESIHRMVKQAGFSADDLQDAISKRIHSRQK